LGVVALAINVTTLFALQRFGVPVTGHIPAGLPELRGPALRWRDVEDIMPLAAGCLLLAYIEGVSAARAFAAKHNYPIDARQELLGIGAANFAAGLGQGYPVAGGLSQSAVNDKAGARSPLALVFASVTLALCLLFLTGLLENLPKAVLAAVVLTAIAGLFDLPALIHMWRTSRIDFLAAIVALAGVLLFGILQGILLAALASVIMLLAVTSRPHVAFLGRLPSKGRHADMSRHPDAVPLPATLAFRPEASLIYVNAEAVRDTVMDRLAVETGGIKRVVCDLSAAARVDLAGARMLAELRNELAKRNISLHIIGALGRVRDLLIADDPDGWQGALDRATLDDLLATADK
jgi:MFS superfamily sulfate permease-like transporter